MKMKIGRHACWLSMVVWAVFLMSCPNSQSALRKKLDLVLWDEEMLELVNSYDDINSADLGKSRLSLLGFAAIYDYPKSVERIIEKGGAVEERMPNGQTAMHVAGAAGSSDVIRVLKSKGAEINSRDNNGDTPLTLILQNEYQRDNNLEAILTLIECGADPKQKNNEGKSALDLAAEFGDKNVMAILTRTLDLDSSVGVSSNAVTDQTMVISPTATQTAPVPGQNYIQTWDGGANLEMVWIPAGQFMMGSPPDDDMQEPFEVPQHLVTLNGFWMGKYEVTQAQYQAVTGTNPSAFKKENRPVEMMTWAVAKEFCRKLSQQTGLNYTLPSEAQWEYACRAGTTTRFYFGDDDKELEKYAWYEATTKDLDDFCTYPVGMKQPNPWGLYDMSGNVIEICEDFFHENYEGAPSDGSAWMAPESEDRVIRDGYFSSPSSDCRSAFRGRWESYGSTVYPGLQFVLGFRVIMQDERIVGSGSESAPDDREQ